jgi:hypothetical protein
MTRLALLAVAALAATAAPAGTGELPTRDCRSRIESGRAPLTFERPGSLVAGPVAIVGAAAVAGTGPRGDDGRFMRKAPALVRAGKPVVLSVPGRYRDRVWVRFTRTDASEVRLEPCAPATRAFSYPGRVGSVTGFSGGFAFTRTGCYPIDVRVENGRAYRIRIPLGYPCR